MSYSFHIMIGDEPVGVDVVSTGETSVRLRVVFIDGTSRYADTLWPADERRVYDAFEEWKRGTLDDHGAAREWRNAWR